DSFQSRVSGGADAWSPATYRTLGITSCTPPPQTSARIIPEQRQRDYGLLLRYLVEGSGKAGRKTLQEVVNLRHTEIAHPRFELAHGNGELAVAGGQLGGALEVGCQLVGRLHPDHELGINLGSPD